MTKNGKYNPIYLILAIVAGISLLTIAFAVTYYLVIYLPKKDIEKLNYENTLKQQQEIKKKSDYDACLIRASIRKNQSWLDRCKANNIRIYKDENGIDNCYLYDYMSKIITDQYNSDKEACLKIYQSN